LYVLELAAERYGKVTVKTAIEKPMRMEILGLERLVSVDALFNIVNTRQSPNGSKEMRIRSDSSEGSPSVASIGSTVQEPYPKRILRPS
jgi:hypothetical protein